MVLVQCRGEREHVAGCNGKDGSLWWDTKPTCHTRNKSAKPPHSAHFIMFMVQKYSSRGKCSIQLLHHHMPPLRTATSGCSEVATLRTHHCRVSWPKNILAAFSRYNKPSWKPALAFPAASILSLRLFLYQFLQTCSLQAMCI